MNPDEYVWFTFIFGSFWLWITTLTNRIKEIETTVKTLEQRTGLSHLKGK